MRRLPSTWHQILVGKKLCLFLEVSRFYAVLLEFSYGLLITTRKRPRKVYCKYAYKICLVYIFIDFISLFCVCVCVSKREMKKVEQAESEKLNQDGDLPRVHFDDSAISEKNKPTGTEIFLNIIREVGNFTLLKENKMLLMIVISNFFAFLCYFTPFTFIPIRAKGLQLENYAYIISIIGKSRQILHC